MREPPRSTEQRVVFGGDRRRAEGEPDVKDHNQHRAKRSDPAPRSELTCSALIRWRVALGGSGSPASW